MIENDSLCISCYDNLKISYNFKSKCVQSDILRRGQVIKIEKKTPEVIVKTLDYTVKDETENELIDELSESVEDPIIAGSKESSGFECSECNEIFKTETLFSKHFDEMHSIETLDLIEIVEDVEIDDDGLIKQKPNISNKKRKRGRASKYPEDGNFRLN